MKQQNQKRSQRAKGKHKEHQGCRDTHICTHRSHRNPIKTQNQKPWYIYKWLVNPQTNKKQNNNLATLWDEKSSIDDIESTLCLSPLGKQVTFKSGLFRLWDTLGENEFFIFKWLSIGHSFCVGNRDISPLLSILGFHLA